MHRFFVAAVVVVLLPSGSASAELCPAGDFATPIKKLAAPATGRRGAVTFPPTLNVILDDTSVSIDGLCPPAPLRRRGNVVRASWTSCGDLRRVRLRARFTDLCNTLTGVVRSKGRRAHMYLLRFPRCGNGFLEAGEECDDGNVNDGDCCTVTCGYACGEGDFCELAAGACYDRGTTVGGTCISIPDACTKELHPVCGCDGETYGNDCDRRAAGVQKDHDGRCGKVCGGKRGTKCPEGDFCEFRVGTCRFFDFPGTCARIPEACTKEFAPVCGCDDRTYGNDCSRRAAGVAKLHDGRCGE